MDELWKYLAGPFLGTGMGGLGVLGIMRFARRTERVIRPERKADLAKLITKAELFGDPKALLAQVVAVFVQVFGSKHLRWKCFGWSVTITASYFGVLGALFATKALTHTIRRVDVAAFTILYVEALIVSIVPDYLSLWKGRLILNRLSCSSSFATSIFWLGIDIFVSVVIALLSSLIIFYPWNLGFGIQTIFSWERSLVENIEVLAFVWYSIFGQGGLTIALFLSSLVASLWVVLGFASVILLRVLSAVNWLIDVKTYLNRHPVRAVGAVLATIWFIGSVAYTWL